MVGNHITVGTVIVRLHHADKSPLTAKHILQQMCIGAARFGTDPVEGGHNCPAGTGVALSGKLKRLQIDFTDCLFRGKGEQEGAAVALLIIQGKVLDIRIEALCSGSVHFRHSQLAAQYTVFKDTVKILPYREQTVNNFLGSALRFFPFFFRYCHFCDKNVYNY